MTQPVSAVELLDKLSAAARLPAQNVPDSTKAQFSGNAYGAPQSTVEGSSRGTVRASASPASAVTSSSNSSGHTKTGSAMDKEGSIAGLVRRLGRQGSLAVKQFGQSAKGQGGRAMFGGPLGGGQVGKVRQAAHRAGAAVNRLAQTGVGQKLTSAAQSVGQTRFGQGAMAAAQKGANFARKNPLLATGIGLGGGYAMGKTANARAIADALLNFGKSKAGKITAGAGALATAGAGGHEIGKRRYEQQAAISSRSPDGNLLLRTEGSAPHVKKLVKKLQSGDGSAKGLAKKLRDRGALRSEMIRLRLPGDTAPLVEKTEKVAEPQNIEAILGLTSVKE